jgi:hypothetical protein
MYCSRREVIVTSTRLRSRLCRRWNCAENTMRSGILVARDWVMRRRVKRLWTVRAEAVDLLASVSYHRGIINVPKRCLRNFAQNSAPIVCTNAKPIPINTHLALVTSEKPVVSSTTLLAAQSSSSGASSCVNAILNVTARSIKTCDTALAIDRWRCGKPAVASE